MIVGNGTATLSWAAVPGATGYLVGRDGTDSGGYGAWSTTDPASARSRTFDKLVNGRTYTLFVQAQPGGARQTIRVTPGAPKPAPTPAPTVAPVTATTGNTTATLTWPAVPGATGYLVGRDGTDAGGYGAWSTTDPASARSRTFDKLVNGRTYTLFVQAQPGGARQTIRVTPAAGVAPAPTPTPTLPTPTVAPKPTPTPTPTPPPVTTPKPTAPSGNAALRILGPTRSGKAWHSGAWTGGHFTSSDINGFGSWRGSAADVVTTYADRSNYATMANNAWSITTWNGFAGKLNYGLAPLPDSGEGSLATIARGDQDYVWTKIAQNLQNNGRGDSVVRIAWEANLKDWRHVATASNAETYKAAWRRIQSRMKAVAPGLKFEFGIACGTDLAGSNDRMAPLTKLYPGDDVVDLVGCDTYDWWNTHATSDANWSKVTRPAQGPGIADIADFARAHGKGASYAEWGLATKANGGGGGDNPYFIEAMHRFFTANADVVVFENYFDEPAPYIANSLYLANQNPRSAAKYRELW